MKIKEKFDKNKIWFTSDPHFCHANIIKYCNRPFDSVEKMNQFLIDSWNNVVGKDDVIFCLGDFILNANSKTVDQIVNSLNGTKYLIVGNHEKSTLGSSYLRSLWKDIHDITEIFVEDDEITYGEQHIVMCHYPMIAWNASHRGSWQLFGHVHGGLSNKGIVKHSPNQLDVGVDCHNYSPISYQQIKEIITRQNMK